MIHLALHHLANPLGGRIVLARQAEDLQRVPDRRERVAELVGEHGDELVLAAVRFLERLGGASLSNRWARISYWRARARSAVRTALISVETRTGRSSNVTLPSISTAMRTTGESAPG